MNSSPEITPQDFDFFKIALGSKDFILLDHLGLKTPLLPEYYQRVAAQICPRFRGVGAASLIVLVPGHDDIPRLLQFTPGDPENLPVFDALMAAAKYLFDTARYGISLIPLWQGKNIIQVEPLDSSNFRLTLGTARSASQILGPEDLKTAKWTVDLGDTTLTGIPLELGAEILVFFNSPSKPKAKKKWLKSFKKVPRLQGRIPVLVDLISPEEIEITLAPESLETDVVAVSALSALAVQLEGFCNDQVLVRCRNHPVFVEISGPQRILKITAPVIYIFTGSFSLRDDKI